MIDYYVEQVIIDLLQQVISTPTVNHAIADSGIELILPAIIVQARQDVAGIGRNQVYQYIVTISYKTIPSEVVAADAVAVMLAVDNALTSGSAATSASTYFNFFAFHGLLQSEYQINKERRLNIREVNCFVQPKNLG